MSSVSSKNTNGEKLDWVSVIYKITFVAFSNNMVWEIITRFKSL